ncbi:DUF2887 domain-containing protein [Desulfonema limicola]|nr:DUF2887 domain-containing protein [Desulfonema limicola]
MKKERKKQSQSKGTDDPFYKLMKIGGEAVLKLIGINQPDNYEARAIVLKEKKLYPDIVAVPVNDKNRDMVFIEFQGYKDTMIRHRTAAKIMLSCAQENYTGPVCGAVIYTDASFKEAAAPLSMKSLAGSFELKGRLEEIVLSEYTAKQLIAVDPRLIILAPFTISKRIRREKLSNICREWKESVCQTYEKELQKDVIEILGLFILNRFRKLSLKEVISMMNFDLAKTEAGKELINMGLIDGLEKGEKKGLQKGLQTARDMLIWMFEEKWGEAPEHITNAIMKISVNETLNELFKVMVKSNSRDTFEKSLIQALVD